MHPHAQSPSLDVLLERGLVLGAYREGIGWSHAGLVALGREFGYEGYNVDLAPQSPTPKSESEAWDALVVELCHGPVMASVYAGLDPLRGGGHMVVVSGFNEGLVQLSDPEALTAQEGERALTLEIFLRAFKRRFVVIRPTGAQ